MRPNFSPFYAHRLRLWSVIAAVALLWSVGPAAQAQTAPPDPAPPESAPEIPQAADDGDASDADGDESLTREERLARAFELLTSDNEGARARGEETIQRIWSSSGSDSMDLLLERGDAALEAEQYDKALAFYTDLVNLAPDFAEGWHRRALVWVAMGELGFALSDLAQALARNPDHFSAYAAVGVILQGVGDDAGALDAFREAAKRHPNMAPVNEAIRTLTLSVEGREV